MSRKAFSHTSERASERERARWGRLTSRIALAALVAGCDRHDATGSTNPDAASGLTSATSAGTAPLGAANPRSPAESTPRSPVESRFTESLAEASVTDLSYARRTLWSWTSREQAATLRRDKLLLLGTELPEGPTPYVQLLERVAAAGGPNGDLARLLLLHPSLNLRRYAWSRPWPTRLGLAERDYGDQLLRVVLAPTAVIARFDPTRPAPFEFRDLDGREVSIGQVLADPSVLAAVYHVRVSGETPVAHREYVLCNESMVAEWSLATPEIVDAISADRDLATALADAALLPAPARERWQSGGNDPASLYASALAFDNERYRSTPENLRHLGEQLALAEQVGPALAVVPRVAFARSAQVPNVRMRKLPIRVRAVV